MVPAAIWATPCSVWLFALSKRTQTCRRPATKLFYGCSCQAGVVLRYKIEKYSQQLGAGLKSEFDAEAIRGRLAEQSAQVVGLGVVEAHRPGSKAVQRPRPFAEHLAVIMAGVRQDAVVVQPPNSRFWPFEHLQKPSFGRVAQYTGDVVQSIVRMALAEQNRQRGSSRGETTAAVYWSTPGRAHPNVRELSMCAPPMRRSPILNCCACFAPAHFC